MANFPNTFTEEPLYFTSGDFAGADAEAVRDLSMQGLVVVAGLRRAKVSGLTAIAGQEGTLESCPNDILTRWTDEPTAEKQLAKDGGRGVFLLESLDTGETAAFGWTGKSSESERKFLPDCENTFALRVSETFRGRGLDAPFSRVIVAGSMALYGANNIGLETWASNTAAVRSYLRAGAALVTTADSKRPTRKPEQQDANGERRDVRLYMKFLQSLTAR